MSTIQEWNDYFHLWRWDGCTVDHPAGIHCGDYPLFETPATKELLIQRAMSFGSLPAISAYVRAFAALKAEGLKPVRSSDPFKVSREETLTAAQYNAMPASRIVVLYRSDESFRAGVDKLIAEGKI